MNTSTVTDESQNVNDMREKAFQAIKATDDGDQKMATYNNLVLSVLCGSLPTGGHCHD